MKSIRMSLLLVTIAIFHPGLALFVVWTVTMGLAFRMIQEGRQELQPVRLSPARDRAIRVERER